MQKRGGGATVVEWEAPYISVRGGQPTARCLLDVAAGMDSPGPARERGLGGAGF